jgi:hypothetical protein
VLRPALAVSLLLVLSGTAYYGLTRHPVPQPPSDMEAQREIASVLSEPEDADTVLKGDLLVERFYFLDTDSGQVKVADICKGRVRELIVSASMDLVGYRYALVLERRNLNAEAERLGAFVRRVAPPDAREDNSYAGLRVQGGMHETFALNYDGSLPEEDPSFADAEGRDPHSFLRGQVFAEASSQGARLISIEGKNFLFGTTEIFPGLKGSLSERAVFLAELILIDATSPAQVSLYSQLSPGTHVGVK